PEQERALRVRAEEPTILETRERVAIDAERVLVEAAQRGGAAQRVALEDREHALRAEAPGRLPRQRHALRPAHQAVPFAVQFDGAGARRPLARRPQRLGLERLRRADARPRAAPRPERIVERAALEREHRVLQRRVLDLARLLHDALLLVAGFD